jgi:hypothetical protein
MALHGAVQRRVLGGAAAVDGARHPALTATSM